MKRDAINHTKMKRLCRELGHPPLYQAVGILELLWHVTARQTPRGDIGRLSDDDIALSIDFREEPRVLIQAVVDAQWVDRNDEHRLIIHDWPDHAEDGVHMKLARAKQFFVVGDSRDPSRTFLVAPKLWNLPPKDRSAAENFFCGHGVATAYPRRGAAVVTDDLFVATNGSDVATAWPRRTPGVDGPRLDPLVVQNGSGSLKDSTEQHHRPRDDEAGLIPFAEQCRQFAGLKRLSKADVQFCGELEQSGVGLDVVRSGIVVGRARRMIHESNNGVADRIQSLRYFSSIIEEAKNGLLDPAYVKHTEEWIQRKEKAK